MCYLNGVLSIILDIGQILFESDLFAALKLFLITVHGRTLPARSLARYPTPYFLNLLHNYPNH